MKPCPFCGSYEIGLDTNINGDQAVICTSCYAAGPGAEIGEDALAAWDDRAAVNHADALSIALGTALDMLTDLFNHCRADLEPEDIAATADKIDEMNTALAAYAAAKEAQT